LLHATVPSAKISANGYEMALCMVVIVLSRRARSKRLRVVAVAVADAA
jgi:hypothetical protein